MKFLFYIGLSLFSTSLFATELPTWLKRTPSDDTQYFYFVGRGTDESESKASDTARADAQASAIRRLFGVTVKVDTRSVETTEDTSLLKQQGEVSQSIHLTDFTEVESFQEEKGGQARVSILFRYPRSAFEAEKDRLSTINETTEISFVSVEEASRQRKSLSTYKTEKLKAKKLLFLQARTPWATYVDFGYGSSTVNNGPNLVSIGISIERHITFFSLRVGAAYVASVANSVDTVTGLKVSASGYSLFAGVPLYLNQKQTFYFEPRVGQLNYEVTGSATSSTVSQHYFESVIAYQYPEFGQFGDADSPIGVGVDARIGGRYLFGDSNRVQFVVGIGLLLKF